MEGFTGILLCPGYHAWYHPGIFCIDGRVERNFRQLADPPADRRTGYGFSFHEYAVLLVLFCGQRSDDLFAVRANRSCQWRLDGLSAFKCPGRCFPVQKGMDLWLISMALFVVVTLLGGLNYISTILNMRTKGMSMTRLPLTIWALFFTAVLGCIIFPGIVVRFYPVMFDRHVGTSFYLTEIFLAGKALPNEGGNAILYQHLFWFLGHPGSIHYHPACYGHGIGSNQLSIRANHFWLFGNGRFFICYCGPGVPGMGAPYVCNRYESFPGICIRTIDLTDRGAFGHKSI